MAPLACTLLTDGSSDVALRPILAWVMRQHVGERAVQCEWADFRHLPSPPRVLADRIVHAVKLYPCQMLFVHRDAERQEPERRYAEVREAVGEARALGFELPYVCVVPVRMQEAWLLLDPAAIRSAAGNPNGATDLRLPHPREVERLPDPKARLYEALKTASGRRGRRLKAFRPERHARIVPDYMEHPEIIRHLPAFRRLEDDVRTALTGLLAETHGR